MSDDRIFERIPAMSSFWMQGPDAPHALQARQAPTFRRTISTTSTVCPASVAPSMNLDAIVLDAPLRWGLPSMTVICMRMPDERFVEALFKEGRGRPVRLRRG